MGYAKQIFEDNFLEYASYFIKDRAIPNIEDGFKPVQRRVIHTLLEMDDGKFHKVANVVGATMKYHPHGDSSIYEALVNLANFDLFIERQGNFGNFLTGDSAAAGRYIECRLLPLAKKVLYNPEITKYVDSYDGRNKEPVVFPAKIPVSLIQGARGIAIGMSTNILPHNPLEVIEAQQAVLKGEDFHLYPDFPGGGIMDVSDYQDGNGSVKVRAKINTTNTKKIIIEELPFGITSEAMIQSISGATKRGRLKLSSINDYTAEKVNIELCLPKGTYSDDIIDILYACTDCEQKISVNCLVIKDRYPLVTTVSDIIKYHANKLVDILTAELNLEKQHLNDKLHLYSLERIFIEERIYKRIEQKRTQEAVMKAVYDGLMPYEDQFIEEVTNENIEHLLKIPIRRISLFDMEKNKKEIDDIKKALKKVEYNLKNIISYSISFLDEVKEILKKQTTKRLTQIQDFNLVDVKEVAEKDKELKFDQEAGYLGFGLKKGNTLFKVSEFDNILIILKNGTYYVTSAPAKIFVGKDMAFCGYADKDTLDSQLFTTIFQDKKDNITYIKRFNVGGYIKNKQYNLFPSTDGYLLKKLSLWNDAQIKCTYKKGKGYKVLDEIFYFSDFLVKGIKSKGVILSKKEISSMKMTEGNKSSFEELIKEEKPVEEETEEKMEQDLPSLFDDMD